MPPSSTPPWQASVDETLRQALVNLGSVPAPVGEMVVALGRGWPGGSLTVDDEGTPSQNTALIEDGVLVQGRAGGQGRDLDRQRA